VLKTKLLYIVLNTPTNTEVFTDGWLHDTDTADQLSVMGKILMVTDLLGIRKSKLSGTNSTRLPVLLPWTLLITFVVFY
jgi:hypothetical protein